MPYAAFYIDLDHTLLDTDTSEREAFHAAMTSIGVADPRQHFAHYQAINKQMWAAVAAGTMRPADVRYERFDTLVADLQTTGHLTGSADPRAMAEVFVRGFGEYGDLYDGATDVLAELRAAGVPMVLVTNGVSDVQRRRIERLHLGRFFDGFVISDEVDVAKPDPKIFEIAQRCARGAPLDESIMVGDNLHTDIAGAANAGMYSCWYNPTGKPLPASGPTPTTQVTSLTALSTALAG